MDGLEGRDGLARVLRIGVAEGADDSPSTCGSGYLIAPDLVLTCAHLFVGRGTERWYVRGDGGAGWTEIRPVPHERYVAGGARRGAAGYDIALCVVVGELPGTGSAASGRVALEALPRRVGHVPCVAVGYPQLAVSGGVSRRFQFRGAVELGSLEGHQLSVSLHPGPEIGRLLGEFLRTREYDLGGGESHWSGVSGAALLTEEHTVVGVVTQYDMAPGAAVAVGVGSLESDARLMGLLADRGLRVGAMVADGVRHGLPVAAVPHQTYAANLASYGSFLTSERLPFVPPGPRDPALPRGICEQLAHDTHGVLVTGAAGAGKSRVCLETAAWAHRRGWTVLHLPRGEGLTTGDVLDVALGAGGERVLLVVDDLPGDSDLDPAAIPRELVGRSIAGVRPRVAVLASAGPLAFERLSRRGVAQRFARVPVPVAEDYRRRVRDRVVTSVVPSTVPRGGSRADALAELCGTRPGLAVLLAEAVEVRDGRLVVAKRSRLPGRPLALWLLTHLDADDLHQPRGGEAGGARPGPWLLAAAAAASACPQPRDAVGAAVARVLARLAAGEVAGATVVDALVRHGWLEERDGVLHSLHDVVTQELLRHCLLTPSGAGAHAEVGRALLDASLAGPVTLARFVRALRALCVEYPEQPGNPPGTLASLVAEVCGGWLVERAARVGVLVGEETLYALLAGPPWRDATLAAWPRLSGPCLAAAEARERAHDVLCCALTIQEPQVPRRARYAPGPVVASALDWLRRHRGHTAAPRVLGTLLKRLAPEAVERAECTELALAWLARHASWARASYLLEVVLRVELSPDDTARVAARALRWLRKHGDHVKASFVLRPLLEHPSLPATVRAQAAERALAWLREHDTQYSACYVFRPLLAVERVRPQHFEAVVPHVLHWFARHGGSATAWRVAEGLFDRRRRGGPPVERVLEWLATHDTLPASHDLLMFLLRVDERYLSPEQARRAITHGLAWLGANGARRGAKDVIDALLARGDRRLSERGRRLDRREFTPGQADETLRHAADWMDRHGTGDLSPQVLAATLGFWRAGPRQRRRVAAHAMRWLREREEAGFQPDPGAFHSVLTTLIRRGTLSGDQAWEALALADRWLRRTEQSLEERFQAGVFRLLTLHVAADAERAELRARLVDTVLYRVGGAGPAKEDGEGGEADLSRLPARLGLDAVRYLLGVRGLSEEWRERLVPVVLDWLERHVAHERADFVLAPLLRVPGLRGGHVVRAVGLALDWLETWCGYEAAATVKQGPARVLIALVRRPDVTGVDLRAAAELALEWMAMWFHRTAGATPPLLGALLSREPDLPPDLMASVFQRTLAWRGVESRLVSTDRVAVDQDEAAEHERDWGEEADEVEAEHGRDEEEDEAAADGPVASRRDGEGEREATRPTWLEERALAWLEAHHHRCEAGRVLGHLASRLWEGGARGTDTAARVLALARAWLARHGEEVEAHLLLKPLLDHHERLGVAARECLDSALRWLDLHRERACARHVLRHAVDHPGLTPDQQRRVVDDAFAWVDRHRDGFVYVRASYVLRPLAEAEYLDAARLRGVADRVVEWAGAMVERLRSLERNGKLGLRGVERPESRWVLRSLLTRDDLPPSVTERALAVAFAAERAPGLPPQFDWELPASEGRTDAVAESGSSLPRFALATLERLESGEAGLGVAAADAIAELVRWRDGDAQRVAGLALRWLERHPGSARAGDICARLVQHLPRVAPDAPRREVVVRHALDWLTAHADDARGAHVLRQLLRRVPSHAPVPERALLWLERHAHEAVAPAVLHPLLGYDGLTVAQRTAAVGHALAWLRRHGPAARGAHLAVHALAVRGGAGVTSRDQVVEYATRWVAGHGAHRWAGQVLAGCLRLPELPAASRHRLYLAALTWLAGYPEGVGRQPVVAGLLARDDLGEEQAARVREYADGALRETLSTVDAGPLLAGYLARGDVPEVSALVVKAREWLDDWFEARQAGAVMLALLRRGEGRFTDLALRWAERHGRDAAATARDLLERLLARGELRPRQRREAERLRAGLPA